MSPVSDQIVAFMSGTATEYAFSAGLTAEERKLVKNTAEKMGLSSRSFGMGSERQIHIFKPATMMTPETKPEAGSFAGTRPAKADESPRISDADTSSTKDSDSESQDPTISIKNTFVHVEIDSKETADPRIIQSMPAGTFAEHIEAEKAATAGSQGRRPLALSDDAMNEVEASVMIFPSTPNAEDQMIMSGGHREAVPVMFNSSTVLTVQWMLPSIATPESITVLPPAFWAPPAPQMPAQGPPQMPAPMLPPRSPATPAPHSMTVLPPACWVSPGSSAVPVSAATESSPHSTHGLPQRPAPMPPQGPPPQAVTEFTTVLPPALWASPALENESSQLPTTAAQGPSPVPPQGLTHGSTPPAPPQGPTPPVPPQVSTPPVPLDGPPPAYLTPGTPVVLQGLANQPDFNGLRGVVSAFDANCGRYNIIIEIGPNAARRIVKVKQQNLLLAQPSMPSEPLEVLAKASLAQAQAVLAKASLVLDRMV